MGARRTVPATHRIAVPAAHHVAVTDSHRGLSTQPRHMDDHDVGELAPNSLDGSIAWVIGGAGLIGKGLVRGYLRAGATVLCNSRHKARLTALERELDNPERLITIHGSMMPEAAEETVATAMELTDGKLDHVATHSAVRWWGRPGEIDETGTLQGINAEGRAGGILSLSHDDFAQQAMMLPLMQFAAARMLIPRLERAPAASYTFVTGDAGERARSPIGQVNAQAVWGLAAALRREMASSSVRIGEVRVGMRFNRSVDERRAEPRPNPLSHEVGTICAGFAATPTAANALHAINSAEDIAALKRMLPVEDKGYPVYFSPETW